MPEPDSSLDLVARAQAGDAAAADELLRKHLPALRAYVRLRVGPALRARESASDIVQSACRDVLGNLERFHYDGEAGFRAWLFAAALRKIADRAEYWSAQKRDVQRESPGDVEVLDVYRSFCSPSKAAIARETMERIERAFEHLDDTDREIIVLARILGLTHAEIGEQLGLTEAGSRSRLFRALAALSEALREESGRE
ncbi:MAG: sigma-70 family RNA polymerase sigma factor [Planctomycetes bacterium]|nr:sigma-70 family RNA polymerase sigma factor [Planctomycetota bacterium]